MVNGINISQQAVARSQYVLQWSKEIQESADSLAQLDVRGGQWRVTASSAENTLAKAVVDIELVNGMRLGLEKLVEKVDQTFRGLFLCTIQQIKENLERASKTLQNRVETLSSLKNPPISLDGRQLMFAYNNQYSEEFNKFYEGRPYLDFACTSIAGHFVLATLRGERAGFLNNIMDQGHRMHARLMKERPPRLGESFEFKDILQEKEFAGLQFAGLHPADAPEITPNLFKIDLREGADQFQEELLLLHAIKNHNKVKEIGAVLTAHGDSFGIVLLDPDEIVFFDSHGHRPLTKDDRAYAVVFKNIESAAQFLAQRMPVVQDGEDPDWNTCVFTPVCLRTHNLNDLLPGLPAVEIQPQTHDTLHTSVQDLYSIVQALEKKNEEGLFEASGHIADLSDRAAVFAMTEAPTSIAKRIFFHVYQLHSIESPRKLDGSSDYGVKAFQDGRASPEECLRAAQRAFIELALAGVEDAIQTKDKAALQKFLAMLERLNLHENDLPKGQKNIAYYLFERLYFHYKDAAESNKTLIHPHNGVFKGDFGRNAFCDEVEVEIDPQFKLDVIKQVRKELKQTWRI